MPSSHALRRLCASSRSFSSSSRAWIQVGDRLPSIRHALVEGSPGNQVDLSAQVAQGKSLIIGVPGAFSEFAVREEVH